MTSRRQLLAATSLALSVPGLARAQVFRSDLAPMPLPVKQDDTIAQGYRRDPLIRWGDRVSADAPAWNPLQPDAEAAALQFGWDARVVGLAVPPAGADGVPRGVLAVVHPTLDPAMALPLRHPADVQGMMQGASLINIEKRGRWSVVDGGYQNRRLHGSTICRVSGPAADSVNNGTAGMTSLGLRTLQGGTMTPWGTLLLAEGMPGAIQSGVGGAAPTTTAPLGYGWVVELDPTDPRSVPVKRTALGRMNHGDLAATLTRDGRAVVYAINRLPGGHLFRFISDGPATDGDALDAGALSVAKLVNGGELSWLPLTIPGEPASFAALADLTAATRSVTFLGGGGTEVPSGFHTPSGLGLDPRKPRLLLACRGDGSRPAGYVLEITPTGGDDAAGTARVTTLFAAGNPQTVAAQYGRAGLPAGSAWVENPETVTVDTRGRAWIGTDRGGAPGTQANGLFVVDLDGPGRGVPLPMYGAPRGAAVGGAALTPDGEVLFTAVRHPGAEPGASFARPGTRWPAFEAGVPPRTTLIGIERAAGGPVGG